MHSSSRENPNHTSTARLLARLVCIGALTACAGGRGSEPPPATAATEPETPPPADPAALQANQQAIDRAATTSEQLADQTASHTQNAHDHATAPAGLPQSTGQEPARSQQAADNTAKNERDREGAAPTPEDQSNQTSDVELAAKIRRAIVGADDLSFTAQNVKIITEDGRVTLRGAVTSAAEKSRVEQTARKAAGSARVVSELEIEK